MSSEKQSIESEFSETEVEKELKTGVEPGSESETAATFQMLDRNAVAVWRWGNVGGFGIILVGVSAGMSALWMFTEAPRWVPVLIEIVVLTLFLINVLWWPRRAYDGWSYLADDQVLELRYGVIWQKSVLIPLSRLQHIDLHRGPLERHYGLGSLEIFTAGTQNASHKVPGLELATARSLREDLVRAAQLESS